MGAVIAKRAIAHCRASEASWLTWLQSATFVAHEPSEWLQPKTRLVVVAPHPDDEVLACGGLIAMHRAQGGEVLVLAVSDGEASHNDSGVWRSALAAVRCNERLDGLNRLGVRASCVTRLSLPDGQIAQHAKQLAFHLKERLCAADVVVTTWRRDGHPDHEASGRAAAQACSEVGCRLIEAPVWMWHWASPGDSSVPWQRLRQVPLRPYALSAKRAALQAHTSQLDGHGRSDGAVLDEAITSRANRPNEYFFI